MPEVATSASAADARTFYLTATASFGNAYRPAMQALQVREGVAPEQIRTHPFGTHPVGNGPFRFVRRVPGQEWVFEANPGFPASLGGRPYLERLIFRVIPMAPTRA
jgi:peptide/nickel transport system substrate-binding protein